VGPGRARSPNSYSQRPLSPAERRASAPDSGGQPGQRGPQPARGALRRRAAGGRAHGAHRQRRDARCAGDGSRTRQSHPAGPRRSDPAGGGCAARRPGGGGHREHPTPVVAGAERAHDLGHRAGRGLRAPLGGPPRRCPCGTGLRSGPGGQPALRRAPEAHRVVRVETAGAAPTAHAGGGRLEPAHTRGGGPGRGREGLGPRGRTRAGQRAPVGRAASPHRRLGPHPAGVALRADRRAPGPEGGPPGAPGCPGAGERVRLPPQRRLLAGQQRRRDSERRSCAEGAPRHDARAGFNALGPLRPGGPAGGPRPQTASAERTRSGPWNECIRGPRADVRQVCRKFFDALVPGPPVFSWRWP
jgi:hypothetical protein